jgi:ketosteroid isomerase-like protein
LNNDEREVWAAEERYWALRSAGDIDGFMALWDDQFAGWPHTTGAPITKNDVRGEVSRQLAAEGASRPRLERVSVRVHGDFAFVFYRVRFGGETFRIHHAWRRTIDGWKIIAGMSARE